MHARPFELYFVHGTGADASPVALESECFILEIECADGDVYELRVWTEAYLTRILTQDRESGQRLGSEYFIPPDLVIARYDVDLIERIVAELIQTNRLREVWRIPDELTAAWVEMGDPAGDVDQDESDAAWPVAWVPRERDLCGCCHLHLAEEAPSAGTGLG